MSQARRGKLSVSHRIAERMAGFEQEPRADMKEFSQHGSVRCGAFEREALEQLRRYITYPALSHEEVQPKAAGWVVLKLKTPW